MSGVILIVKAVVIAMLAGVFMAGCSAPPSAAAAPNPTAMRTPTGTHLAFNQLRSRPLGMSQIPAGERCPDSRATHIGLGGTSLQATGTAPFYFGPWGIQQSAGDLSKTPWTVDLGYTGRLVARGRRIDGPGQVAFGFWPEGFGTPSEQPGFPVAFSRVDQLGRRVVYQGELDIDASVGSRKGANFWSFPSVGCYAIQVDGDAFTHFTVITVR